MRHAPRVVLFVTLAALAALAACSKGGANAPAAAARAASANPSAAAAPVLLLAAEDLRTLSSGPQTGGPVITGALLPERRADLRSEISAVVLQVLKENGQAVRSNELLVRLDDTAIRDNLSSAEQSARAATQAFEQAERQVQRQKTLQAQGMTSTQALEDAEVRRNSAQSELVAARARVATARQQLQRTEVRAPFDGLVSERKVSAGDTAQVGKELVKVIDPRSMRFEGLVSADRVHEIKIGQTVSFRVNGYAQPDFIGKVHRVDAAANATTRQVAVIVAFAEPAGAPRVAGLFAEGHIESSSTQVLMVPEASVLREGESTHVWRVKAGTLRKVAVRLGERDARRGEYPVLAGLAAGEQILRNPGSTLIDGQKVETALPAAAASAAAAKAVTQAATQAAGSAPAGK